MSAYFTPLEVCEALLGGIEQIAKANRKHVKTPFAWRHASRDRDAGDIPSARDMRGLLAYSKRHKLGLTPEHLIHGATSAGIDRILAARQQPELARVG